MIRLTCGDSLQLLLDVPDASVDAIIADPPYGLALVGSVWDSPWLLDFPGKRPNGTDSQYFEDWNRVWVGECYRVLKPGGVAKLFGATRMFHRLITAMSLCGFQNLDVKSWVYVEAMPKGAHVGGLFDQRAGADRGKVIQRSHTSTSLTGYVSRTLDHGTPQTPLAKQWDGWYTDLKPAWEPYVIGYKL